jgi:hypothetical protein
MGSGRGNVPSSSGRGDLGTSSGLGGFGVWSRGRLDSSFGGRARMGRGGGKPAVVCFCFGKFWMGFELSAREGRARVVGKVLEGVPDILRAVAD